MRRRVAEVGVVGRFHDEPTDADLAEVVDGTAELVNGVVELVGVLVEEGEQELLASLPVAPLPRCGSLAADAFERFFGGAEIADSEIPESGSSQTGSSTTSPRLWTSV